MAEGKGGGAVFGADADEDAGDLGGDEAEPMLNEDLMRRVIGLASGEQGGEDFLRHGLVGGVLDAGNDAPVLQTADGAQELHLRALLGLEGWRFGEDRIRGKQERHGGCGVHNAFPGSSPAWVAAETLL